MWFNMGMDNEVQSKVEKFFSAYPLRRLAKGQVLILKGEDVSHVYRLVKGRVKQYDVSYRGDEIILNIFQPPAFFPMSLAINRMPNHYIYEAETDVELRQAPAAETAAFVKENPDVMLDLLSRLYRGMDGVLGRMTHLMASSAKGRLMYELLLACRRHGERTAERVYRLQLTEGDIAKRAGLSRETVSREIRKLKDEGLVALANNTIAISDVTAFEEKLGKVV